VCGFADLARQTAIPPTHVMSILDPDVSVPPELASFAPNQRLELRFGDVIDEIPGVRPPNREDIGQLLSFARESLGPAAAAPHLLLHCHAGYSRSPAAALLAMAAAYPEMPAQQAVDELWRIRPNIWPNLRVIEIGDQLLGRDEEIVRAVRKLYRQRLIKDPDLARRMAGYGRAREVEAAKLA